MKKDVVVEITTRSKMGPCDDVLAGIEYRHVHNPNELEKLVNDLADESIDQSITIEVDGLEDYLVVTDGDVFFGDHQSEFSLGLWVKKVFED